MRAKLKSDDALRLATLAWKQLNRVESGSESGACFFSAAGELKNLATSDQPAFFTLGLRGYHIESN